MGTPQGGVISPLLANLFMHYVFDKWLAKYYPKVPWYRYADDGILHCHSEAEATEMREVLRKDLANADWKCIRRKRELSTAKMEAGRVIMNIPCSTFWGTHSGDA